MLLLGVDTNNWGSIIHVTASNDANDFTNGFYYWNHDYETPVNSAVSRSEGGLGIISFYGGNIRIQVQFGPGIWYRLKWSYEAWTPWSQVV